MTSQKQSGAIESIEDDYSALDPFILLTVELSREADAMFLMEEIKKAAFNIVKGQGKVKAGVTSRQAVKGLV